jgi:uncharacterized protein involved in exopolysaccharide biosynthesis
MSMGKPERETLMKPISGLRRFLEHTLLRFTTTQDEKIRRLTALEERIHLLESEIRSLKTALNRADPRGTSNRR